jgi:hypothetical protein
MLHNILIFKQLIKKFYNFTKWKNTSKQTN